MGLEKVKDKLAEKLFENIQKTKSTDLITFLSSLGITGGYIINVKKLFMRDLMISKKYII